MTNLADVGEFGFIERIAKRVPQVSDVVEGIGDDCAVVRAGNALWAITCDLSIEDVHFRMVKAEPEDVGWKAAAVNISDIAAMGAEPRFALLSIATPMDRRVEELERICQGVINGLTTHGAVLIGGDTTRSSDKLVLDLTLIGAVRGDQYKSRSTAKDGDILAVTGYPGRAAAGLHAQEDGNHAPDLIRALHRPDPLVQQGQWLNERPGVHSMIDVSDGLLQDASHIGEASGIGVDITSNKIPIAGDLRAYCDAHGLEAAALALAGGEDYELVVTLDPAAADSVCNAYESAFGTPLTMIGECTTRFSGTRLDDNDPDLPGFDHFRRWRFGG